MQKFIFFLVGMCTIVMSSVGESFAHTSKNNVVKNIEQTRVDHFNYVLKSIKNNYPGVSGDPLRNITLFRNKTGILPGDKTMQFLFHAVQIPKAEERRIALEKLIKNPPREFYGRPDSLLTDYMKLALLDEKSWKEYISFARIGLPVQQIFNPYGSFMLHIPPDYKRNIKKWIGDVYEGAGKEEKGIEFLPGKRFLDAILSRIANPYRTIRAHLDNGKTPADAYQQLLRDEAQYFPSKSTLGKYDTALIRSVTQVMQRVLKKEAPSHLDLGNGKILSYGDISLTISGSFPMGRAKLATSDIDLAGVSYSSEVNDWHDELRKKINTALKNAFKGTYNKQPFGLKIGEIHSAVFNELHMARISPVNIRIKPNSIHLVVYNSVSGNVYDNSDEYNSDKSAKNSVRKFKLSQLPAIRKKEYLLPW